MTAQIIQLHRHSFLYDAAFCDGYNDPAAAESAARAFVAEDWHKPAAARQVQHIEQEDEDSPNGPIPVTMFILATCLITGVIARLVGAPGEAAAITGWLGGAVVAIAILWLKHWSEE